MCGEGGQGWKLEHLVEVVEGETEARNEQGKTEARKDPGPPGMNWSSSLCSDILQKGPRLRPPSSLVAMVERKGESSSVGAGVSVGAG